MTTLIAVHNSDGLVGRCDARCYNAHEPECTCICHGANHGKGLDRAIENTRGMAETWLETYAQQNNLKNWWSEIPARAPIQLPLFDVERSA
jgi:predicted RNase H-like HicB family nuclease